MWCFSIILFLFLHTVSAVVVSTKSGRVEGSQRKYHGLHKNGSYFSFQGIPYASPPVGSLRFKDPVPLSDVWEGDLNVAGDPPPVCPQPKFFDPTNAGGINGDENCLYLNIYTEGVPSSGLKNMELKPVMFWIHGGGFMIGSGAAFGDGSGSDFLLESGMVVVTINYRLGALGFLALEGSSITGNQGMKDQVLAMRWVKENIANFGGDPGRITISGESAGAISVHAQVISPLGKNDDLFQRAISFSGTMLMLSNLDQTLTQSKYFFQRVCKTKDGEIPENLESSCLYSLTAEDFVKEGTTRMITSKLSPRDLVNERDEDHDMYLFFPVIDYWADEPFLPSHPITILHNQQQKMVPFMTGLNKEEGALNIVPNWKNMDPEDNQLAENWGYVGAQQLFLLPKKEITFDEELTARMVAQFYVGKDGIKRENKQGLMDMFTDAWFAYPNTETVKLHAKASAPVYNYLLTYKGSASFAPVFARGDPVAAKEDFGVSHVDDLMYLFRVSFGNFSSINTEEDEKFVEIWQQLVVNFARYGNPTPVPLDNIPNWPTAQNSRAACVYLDVGLEPKEKHRIFAERMQFWNKLFFTNLIETYAISEQDNQLLAEIDTVIIEEEEEEDESEEEDHHKDMHKHKRKHRNGKRKGNWRTNMKNKRLRKQKRLAKKLKQLHCA